MIQIQNQRKFTASASLYVWFKLHSVHDLLINDNKNSDSAHFIRNVKSILLYCLHFHILTFHNLTHWWKKHSDPEALETLHFCLFVACKHQLLALKQWFAISKSWSGYRANTGPNLFPNHWITAYISDLFNNHESESGLSPGTFSQTRNFPWYIGAISTAFRALSSMLFWLQQVQNYLQIN